MIRKLEQKDKENWAKLYNDYANNWDGIRWITHSSNENAKKLYDKIANNTGFELYELKRD